MKLSKPRQGLGALALLPAAFAFTMTACNTNVIEPLAPQKSGPEQTVPYDLRSERVPMDILWVVDNSFSMCEEQKVLRDNFSLFTREFDKKKIDFHIALTTTHAPEGAGVIEPIAKEALIQSTPQPVPGNNVGCVGTEEDDFAALRESLEVAKRCLADSSTANQYEWTTAQIACARQAPTQQAQSACVASSGLPDRNGDSRYDVFDLFPDYSDYRVIPRVLRSEDYTTNGVLDVARLELDFSCMSTVGTRGDGYEKGLRAAVNAVSKELTGGAVGLEGSDMSAPNYGFIRPDAGFSLIFVTDENDCSHDGSIEELGNACGSNICEYMNSEQVVDAGNSKLVRVTDLAEQLRENLAATKGLSGPEQLDEQNLFMASINGTSKRSSFSPELKTEEDFLKACQEMTAPDVSAACESTLGRAYSGDRYERFIRQFRNFYPNQILQGSDDREATRLDFSQYEPFGWMCVENFVPALRAIAEFIEPTDEICLDDAQLKSCANGEACGMFPYEGGEGVCDQESKVCSDSVVVTIAPDRSFTRGERRPLEEVSVCLTDSIGVALTSRPQSCVVDPATYRVATCSRGAGAGVAVSWLPQFKEGIDEELAGYDIFVTYAHRVGIED